ncbi:glycosyltransferase [Thermodesulfobacteriota bacterium]
MVTMRKTAIIVPCYNEAIRIQKDEFLHNCDLHQHVSFIFVNDCSEDDTARILQELQSIKPKQISTITLSKNSGKAEAVRQGLLYALGDDFDYIGYWDADLSTPLSNIEVFIGKLDESPERDIIMGARVKLLGRSIFRQPLRHYLGRTFATFTSMVLGLSVYDTQCGAKMFRNSPLLIKIFAEPFRTRWIFDVEILARYLAMSNNNLQQIITEKIVEYPLESWTHVSGSKIRIKDFAGGALDLFRIWLSYHKNLVRIRKDNSNT